MRGYVEQKTPEMLRREALAEIREYSRLLDTPKMTVGVVMNLMCACVHWANADRLIKNRNESARKGRGT